jgi:hypothetical protein
MACFFSKGGFGRPFFCHVAVIGSPASERRRNQFTQCCPGDFYNNWRKTWSILMSTRGLYRTIMPESGAEYARVFYRNASPPGEIPKPLYEARGYKPRFDTLPTKGEGESAQTSDNTNETDIGEQAYMAIYKRLLEVGLLEPNHKNPTQARPA